MKGIILLLACLVLASAVKASEMTYEAEDAQKYEDELMEEDLPGATEGDEKAPIDEEQTEDDQNDDKLLVNGQAVAPEEMDSVEDEDPTVIDGVEQGDEMDETAEDPAPNGWLFVPFHWCTTKGRTILKYGSEKNKISAAQCQALCVAKKGCKAIEHWNKYNYACFWCTNPSLRKPYTNKKDLAYPAHVWLQRPKPTGITPTKPTKPTTTPTRPTKPTAPPTRPTIPSHPAVNVTCAKNDMWISIPKNLLHGLDRDHLRLSDLRCGAKETKTHYMLHTSLTGCGTVKRHTSNFVCYMNKVEEIPIQKHQIITRVREVEIPFACYYSNMGVVSAVGLQVKSKKIVFSKKGYGKFVLEMNIFPDYRFQNPYKKKDFPVMVPLRKWLFIEVSVDTDDRRLAILAEECFATPDPNPNKLGVTKYTFIRDGCSVDKDDTLTFLPSADKRRQRWKMEAFAFVGDHQFVYMHCRIKVCDAADPNSRCAKGCIRRGKRSLMTQESNDDEYMLAQGPFMRGAEDETQIEQTMKKVQDVEKSAKFPTLVAAMAVVAAVCVMGVSYFAWDKRKQKALRDYQRLTVPAED